jgi:outer membrane protein assembly factor BamD
MNRSIFHFVAVLIAAGVILTGCSSFLDMDTSTPEGSFKVAEKLEKDGRFEEATAQYSQVKNKFPYSKLATEAELRMADIHFKREEYIESQNAYQAFKEMHPSFPRSDYVTFRLAMSFFNQLPATIDRDLSVAERAILYFDEITQSFSRSEYAKDAAEHKRKALRMLAEKEFYVGRFYLVREHWESALNRFEGLLQKYPGMGLEPESLYGAAKSAYEMKDLGKAKTYYQRLTTEFKDSSEAEKARRELGNRI